MDGQEFKAKGTKKISSKFNLANQSKLTKLLNKEMNTKREK